MNFSAAYTVIPKTLRVGINGYYLNQLTNTEADGREISNTGEEVFAIGPGAIYHLGADNHFFLNVFFETNAENRPEGSRVNFRYVHHF